MLKHTPPTSAQFRHQLGFTLVELLLFMGLFTGFLTVLSALFVSTLDTQAESVASANLDQNSWYLLSRFQYDFGQASSVVFPVNNGDVDTILTLDQSGTPVSFSLASGQLIITRGGVSSALTSDGITVSNLSFQRLGSDDGAVTVTVHMELTDAEKSLPKVLDFTMGPR